MTEYDAAKHNSPPTEQEIRKLDSYEYGNPKGWAMEEMLKEFGYIPENGHSNINTLIEQNEYGPIKPNALMETSMAYQNPNAILKHLLPSKGNDTLLEDIIDMFLRSDTKGLSDRLPSMEQTRGETGGLINALLRGIRTGSYERKKSPLLDELK